ncbi:dehydrogenase [Intrasporangium oryzae NRRL B-24470]|uniref:Dehydrogenase n=1 Tax=Intrasporangium oryzae NRRL B-24470 TaxID=1386089 RepID=W9GE63_9MICO|nr:YciI family protein [Intrasporangium oryzae]EWT02159.1 dehydrogenase [Intrasporangium oryzae NRRL B-24470]
MRFMIIVPATPESEAGVLPTEQQLLDMTAYNEELLKAGVLVDGEGLRESSKGARLTYSTDGEVTVTDGPFAEAKELIAGFTMIEVSSKEEAIEWLKNWPRSCAEGEFTLELRQVFAPEDFGDAFTPELQEREARMREEAARAAAQG